jgi:hypothetical protein
MLTVSVTVVAVPGRPVRRLHAEKIVHHLHAVANHRIIRPAKAAPHELEKVPAHLRISGEPGIAGEILDREHPVERRV